MTWKEQLKEALRLTDSLASTGIMPVAPAAVVKQYPPAITPHYYSLINPNDPNDPLLRIVAPSAQEARRDGLNDTMGEQEDYRVPGLQHRYPETAMLVVNNFCASYCRYCFRKRLFDPLQIENESVQDIPEVLRYLGESREITNVLFSGGDPLVSSVKRLAMILNGIAQIPHIDFVRIGSKIPAFLPQRILEDDDLLSILGAFARKKTLIIVAHFDHAREISPESQQAVERLLSIGIPMVSHGVLLKGVNDSPVALHDLLRKLIASKIVPYYIYHAMPVPGSGHFQVPIVEGWEIFRQATQDLAGLSRTARYIIPHYVGKLECLGTDAEYIYLRYHQTRNRKLNGRMARVRRAGNEFWFEADALIQM